MTYLYMYPL